MSNEFSITQAAPGWWAVCISYTEEGGWTIDDKSEVLAWYISPCVSDKRGVEDFITHPVTYYGTLDEENAVLLSPSGKWYSVAVPGSFDSLETLGKLLIPKSGGVK